MILLSSTHPRWFAASSADLPALLSDHLHCERKAAENALSLVRRYPHRGASVDKLGRLAHEETSHVVQVGALLARRGWTPRADMPNRYARGLLAEVRGREPERLFERGSAAPRAGEARQQLLADRRPEHSAGKRRVPSVKHHGRTVRICAPCPAVRSRQRTGSRDAWVVVTPRA